MRRLPVDFIDAWLDIRRVAFRLGAASPCGDGEPESTPVDFMDVCVDIRRVFCFAGRDIRRVSMGSLCDFTGLVF